MKTKSGQIAFTAMFTALTAIGAFIKIPVPVCPFTLQFLFTTLAGLLLGSKRGALSVLCYVILGLVGLPIFASGGGPSYVLQPTFGYMPGFICGTFITGLISEKQKAPTFGRLIAACFAGLAVVYAFGIAYYWLITDLYLKSEIGFAALFLYCFVLAVPGDILLCVLSTYLGKRLIPVLRKEQAT